MSEEKQALIKAVKKMQIVLESAKKLRKTGSEGNQTKEGTEKE